MKNRTDLILGEAFCIFIFFYFLDSGLSVLNGLQFYFRLRDSENREYVLELTVGFESNHNNNAVRKKEIYLNLINEMSRKYRCVRFVNLSMSSLGVFSDECSTFLDMMNDICIDKKQQRYIIKKMINIAIRATYYIFCCRNRNWDSPDVMQF